MRNTSTKLQTHAVSRVHERPLAADKYNVYCQQSMQVMGLMNYHTFCSGGREFIKQNAIQYLTAYCLGSKLQMPTAPKAHIAHTLTLWITNSPKWLSAISLALGPDLWVASWTSRSAPRPRPAPPSGGAPGPCRTSSDTACRSAASAPCSRPGTGSVRSVNRKSTNFIPYLVVDIQQNWKSSCFPLIGIRKFVFFLKSSIQDLSIFICVFNKELLLHNIWLLLSYIHEHGQMWSIFINIFIITFHFSYF